MNNVSKLLLTAGLAAGFVLVTPGCSENPGSKSNGPIPRTFLMGYNPIQCTATPWEADSLSVEDYYAQKGADILDTRQTRQLPTCAACGCSRGYTLVAEVAEEDTLVLMNDGFFNFHKGR